MTEWESWRERVLNPDNRRGTNNLAVCDHRGNIVKRDPAHNLSLIGIGLADEVSTVSDVKLLGTIGRANQRLKREQLRNRPGPPAGFFLNFTRSGGRAVLRRVYIATRKLPHPPPNDEPMTPQHENMTFFVIQHKRRSRPPHPHDVLIEPRPVRQFD